MLINTSMVKNNVHFTNKSIFETNASKNNNNDISLIEETPKDNIFKQLLNQTYNNYIVNLKKYYPIFKFNHSIRLKFINNNNQNNNNNNINTNRD